MKLIKFGALALAAVCGVGAAFTSAKSSAKRVLPFTYHAQASGSGFIWVTQPAAGLVCEEVNGASCTITTTVAPASIASYNNTYLPGRTKNPSTPTNRLYQ
jgi:hypothetical protein